MLNLNEFRGANLKIHLNYGKWITTLIMVILIVIPAYATTYYVDYATGNDNNDGLTKTSAFKHSPGDPSATGLVSGINLQAGDVVQFRGGIEYKGQVLLSSNGNANNYIEYRGQGWGSGRATFNMEFTREYGFKGGKDYIKISGINFYNYPSTGTDYVIYPINSASNWVIDSCTIAYIKDWNNVSLFPDKASIFLSNSTSHITILNSEFFASGRTIIKLRYVSYVNIENCNFGGINRGDENGWFSVAIRGEVTCNNIHIVNNIFHDGWQYGGDQVPELNHAPAFIHIYGSDSNNHPDQIYIERNYFYNDKAFSTGTGTGSLEITTQVHNVFIRNNIFANACQYWGSQLLLAGGCDKIYVENNTFIDRQYTTGYGIHSLKVYLGDNPVGNNIFIKNNIFWTDADGGGNSSVAFSGNAPFQGEINQNAYFGKNSSRANVLGSSIVSWTSWQAAGFDANSHFYNITNPAFVYMPPTGATTSSGNYSIDSTAVDLIDKGVTLSGFDDSYNTVQRPQGAAWDIGAFEFKKHNILNDNIPPEVTGASISNATTVVVNFSEVMETNSSQNTSNYNITNGISVTGAVLSSNGKNVTLTTSTHTAGQNYTITVNNVTDLAGNPISSSKNSAGYSFFTDTTPPELVGASLKNSTTLIINFSEELETSSAQNKSNYSINNGIIITGALLSSDGKKVTLTTSTHTAGQNYTVTVNNVTDLAGNPISSSKNSAGYSFITDTTPPELVGASLKNSTTLVINFSEELETSSSQNKSNYSINNGIIITGALLSSDGKKVTLTTSTHTAGQNYTITVNNVTDLAGNPISSSKNSAGYSFIIDTTAPELTEASLAGNRTVFITFSEEIDSISAEDTDNYSIDNGISIDNATLINSGTVVSLTTSVHSPNTLYTLTVNNVKDLAGNVISQQGNTVQYQKGSNGGSSNGNGKHKLNVNIASAQWYQNYTPYKSIDGDLDITSNSRWGGVLAMPDSIVFDLDSVDVIDETHFSFYRWDQGRIYQFSVKVSVDGVNWTEVLTNVTSSTSEWTINQFDSVEARYVKLISISSNESQFAGLWEAEFWGPEKSQGNGETTEQPSSFELAQNYPNPFNPTTTIQFSIPVDQHVKINVYNVIGELVQKLTDQNYSLGIHKIEFDASKLSSGIYFYRLESQSFTSTKKMILAK